MKKPRVLIYDIETTPNLAYVWGKWQQDVIKYENEWSILCFAYKWLGEKKTHVVALPDFKGYKSDKSNDFYVTAFLWKLFDEADVLIAHNGNSFDQKKSQARMLHHGFTPPSPYRQIDTKLVAKRYFNMNSNKLEDIGNYLGVGHKAETGGFDTWLGCMNGDKKSWERMKKYNKQDVVLLEKIYLKLLPWIENHPAMNILSDRLESCPKCGKGPLQRRGTRKVNKTTINQRYQCQSCGGWSQARASESIKPLYTN